MAAGDTYLAYMETEPQIVVSELARFIVTFFFLLYTAVPDYFEKSNG